MFQRPDDMFAGLFLDMFVGISVQRTVLETLSSFCQLRKSGSRLFKIPGIQTEGNYRTGHLLLRESYLKS